MRVGISGTSKTLVNFCWGQRVTAKVFIDFSGINDRWNLLVYCNKGKWKNKKNKQQIEAFVRRAEDNLVWAISHRYSSPSYG